MKKTKSSHVSEEKKKQVSELKNLIDNKNTIMIASIKSLPAAQFQKIKKSLSKDTDVRVVKKRVILRAIEDSKKEGVKGLKEFITSDVAVLFTDNDSFELAKQLSKSKSPVKAKAGQESPQDIEIEAGTTDLPAGPAVSELGSVGLAVKVTNGKIEILQNKVIVKKGQTISEAAASVMGKLDVLPFSVGFIPLVSYDSNSNLIFQEMTIDPKKTANDVSEMASKARNLAINIVYICKETIGYFISKASQHEKAILRLTDKVKESNEDIPKEEPKLEEAK